MALPDFDGTDFLTSRVWIDGGYVGDMFSWVFTRNLTGLPGGVTDATNAVNGKLVPSPTPSEDPLINSAFVPPTPWTRKGGWPPRRGVPVQIEVSRPSRTVNGLEQDWVRVFTGFVDSISGGTWGDLEIDVVDGIDLFTANVQVAAAISSYPTGDGNVSPLGLTHAHVVNQCFEAAGFYATIPNFAGSLVRVPLLGSLAPLQGKLYSSSVGSSIADSTVLLPGPEDWGQGFTDFTAQWRTQGTSSHNWYLFHRVSTENAADYTIDILKGTTTIVIYRVKVKISGDVQVLDPSNNVIASLSYGDGQVGSYVVVTLADPGTETSPLVLSSAGNNAIVRVPRTTDVPGQIKMTCPAGSRPGGVLFGNMDKVFPDDLFDAVGATPGTPPWEPTAHIEASEYVTTLAAITYEWNVQASTVLDKIASATCSHWGLDEDGKAVFLSTLTRLSDYYLETASLTDDTDVFDDLQWSSNWQDSCSQVKAVFEVPRTKVIVRDGKGGVLLWRGSATEIDAGKSSEEFIHADDSEDWIDVEGAPDDGSVGSIPIMDNTWGMYPGSYAAQLKGSLMSGTYGGDDGTGGDGSLISPGYLTNTFTRLDPASFKLVTTAHTKDVTTAFYPNSPVTYSQRGKGSPAVRGKGKITWGSGWIFTDNNGTNGPVYEHDCGRWTGDNGVGIAGKVYEILSGEQVRFDGIDIRPDLDIRLGSLITVTSQRLGGLVLRCIVSGVTMQHDATGFSMALDLVCPEAIQGADTWGRVEDYYQSQFTSPTWGDVETQVNSEKTGATWKYFEEKGAGD